MCSSYLRVRHVPLIRECGLTTLKGHGLRTLTIDGNPWFVAKDVFLVLGFNGNSNGKGGFTYSHHLKVVSADEHMNIEKGGRFAPPPLFKGTASRVAVISESGLYKLVMRSDKPQARAFQDWVTRTVLPALRKDGMYIAGELGVCL